MGFSISWIAVQTDSPDAVCSKIGLRRTCETLTFFEFPISGIMLPSSWYIVVFNNIDHALQGDENLQRISEEFSILRCLVEEHVMYSSAEAWLGGNQIWNIVHNSENGTYDLATTGDVPNEFNAIKEDLITRQNAEGGKGILPVDYIFDAPLVLAQRITGFKHSRHFPENQPEIYENLVALR